jgi:hypothetical protein
VGSGYISDSVTRAISEMLDPDAMQFTLDLFHYFSHIWTSSTGTFDTLDTVPNDRSFERVS